MKHQVPGMRGRSKSRWFPFDLGDNRDSQFKNELVISCYLGKVVQFYERRNVWGPTSFIFGGRAANSRNTYNVDESFTFDLAAARAKIERQRTRGSKWSIDEIPALVIAGEESRLIIGEINNDEPLTDFPLLRSRLLSLGDYFLHFRPHGNNSVFRFVCKRKLVRPATFPFYSYRSRTHGGHCPLHWERFGAERDLEGMLRVVHQVNRLLQRKASPSV